MLNGLYMRDGVFMYATIIVRKCETEVKIVVFLVYRVNSEVTIIVFCSHAGELTKPSVLRLNCHIISNNRKYYTKPQVGQRHEDVEKDTAMLPHHSFP